MASTLTLTALIFCRHASGFCRRSLLLSLRALALVGFERCIRPLRCFKRRVGVIDELCQFCCRRQNDKRSVHLHAVLALDKLAVELRIARSIVIHNRELLILLAAPVVAEDFASDLKSVCAHRYSVALDTRIDDVVLRCVDAVGEVHTPILVHDVHNDVRAGRQRKSHLLAVHHFAHWYAQREIVASYYFLHILFFWLFFFCCGYGLVSSTCRVGLASKYRAKKR